MDCSEEATKIVNRFINLSVKRQTTEWYSRQELSKIEVTREFLEGLYKIICSPKIYREAEFVVDGILYRITFCGPGEEK